MPLGCEQIICRRKIIIIIINAQTIKANTVNFSLGFVSTIRPYFFFSPELLEEHKKTFLYIYILIVQNTKSISLMTTGRCGSLSRSSVYNTYTQNIYYIHTDLYMRIYYIIYIRIYIYIYIQLRWYKALFFLCCSHSQCTNAAQHSGTVYLFIFLSLLLREHFFFFEAFSK